MPLTAQQTAGPEPWLKEERHRIFEVINFNEYCNYSSKLDPFIFVCLTKKLDPFKTFISLQFGTRTGSCFFTIQYQAPTGGKTFLCSLLEGKS